MNQMMVLCAVLVCLMSVAVEVDALAYGTFAQLMHSEGVKGGKAHKKVKLSTEFLESLGNVCSKCSKYQSACMKLQELNYELNKLPIEEKSKKPTTADPKVKVGAKKEERKDSKFHQKISEIEADFN